MPFFRRTFRSRFRGAFRRRRSMRTGMKAKFRALSKKVNQQVKASLQYTTTSNISSSSSGSLVCVHNGAGSSTSNGVLALSVLSQGVGQAQRVGNYVTLKRLTVTGITYMSVAQGMDTTGGLYPCFGRIIFWVVRSNSGNALATGGSDPTTLLQDFTSNTLSVINAPFNPDTVPSRAIILKDIRINPASVNQVVTGTGLSPGSFGGRQIMWKFSTSIGKFLRGAMSTYNGSGSGATALEMNHIFCCFLQNNVVSFGGSLTSYMTFKLSFIP